MRKKDIVWLANHRCRKHSHTYLEHYNCYLVENPRGNRQLGFFDIETFSSNFSADRGVILCYCLKEQGTNEYYESHITPKELKSKDLDKRLVKQCIKDLSNFDAVSTYYGTGFDLPFLRTRALVHKLDFFNYGELFQEDVYYSVRSKLGLSKNSLDNACKTVLGSSKKTYWDFFTWLRAVQGDKDSMKKIVEHCHYDVDDLEDLYNRLENFTIRRDKSI